MKRTISDAELFNAIKNSIKNKTPLSYIRLGDGEIQIMKIPQHCNTPDETNMRKIALTHICKRYNVDFNEDCEFLLRCKKIIIDSINASDYLGLFTPEEIGELAIKGMRINANRYAPNKEILNYYNIDSSKLKICSVMFNKGIELGIISNFKKLIGDQRITMITNQTANLKANKKFQEVFGDSVDFINIKHEHGNPNAKALSQRVWLRSQFKDIKNHIVLLGVGHAAKDLCNELKNDWGKCAIDMGSVLDAWAGIISRPSYGNVWSQCLTVPVNEAPSTDICYK
jgi:hypothetical protein